MTTSARISAGVLLAALATGCGALPRAQDPSMVEDMGRLNDELFVLPPFPEPIPQSGSLWTDAGPGAALARDTRAFRINDLVTITLQEQSFGSHQSDTDLNRSSSADFGAGVAFGLEKVSPAAGSFNLNQVLSTSSSSAFAGDGSTSRSNALDASITARVMRVLPNGDMVIGGQKTVMINHERQILTLVGTIRAVDVNSANRVASTAVGDLTVRLWGKGEIDSTTRQGWFMKILHRVWPF